MPRRATDCFQLNGVDALTGGPLRDAQTILQVVDLATAEYRATPQNDRNQLRTLSQAKTAKNFGMDVEHLDDINRARWGLIVPAGGGREVSRALAPLIDHRARQIGAAPRVFEVEPQMTAVQFLQANGVERGLGVVSS